jgi:HlyD family secretion protein
MRKDIILLIVGLVIMGSGFYFKSKSNEPLVNFLTTTSSSTSTSTETVLAIGVVELVDTISVAAQSTGTVKEVYVNFNTSVKKGELLAKMDATAANAQVNQARNHLVAAQTNHETKRLRAQAQKKSYNHGAISQADYQIIQNEPKIAQLAVDTALLNLKIAEKKLIDLNIYAPENGIVLNRNINAGETIDSSAHAPTLFVIAKNLNKVRVRAQVVEQDIPFVEIGQEAVFTVVDIPNELFEGRVQSVSSQGTLISVLNPETGLIAGMKVNIIIYIGKKDNSLSVPNQ